MAAKVCKLLGPVSGEGNENNGVALLYSNKNKLVNQSTAIKGPQEAQGPAIGGYIFPVLTPPIDTDLMKESGAHHCIVNLSKVSLELVYLWIFPEL